MTGDGEEMGFTPSELRFTGVSGEGVLLFSLDTEPGFLESSYRQTK